MTRDEFLIKFGNLFEDFFSKQKTDDWVTGYRNVLHPALDLDYKKLYIFLLTNWTKFKIPPEPVWFKQFIPLCVNKEEKEEKKVDRTQPIPERFYEAKKLISLANKLSNKYKV